LLPGVSASSSIPQQVEQLYSCKETGAQLDAKKIALGGKVTGKTYIAFANEGNDK
jgi:hypothetical protein